MLTKVNDFQFVGLTEELLSIDELLSSHYLYEQGLIKFIKGERAHDAYSASDLLANPDCPIKIEGFERHSPEVFDECERVAAFFDHNGPVTCHLFISPKDSLSFPLHADYDDVIVHMVSGQKLFESPTGDKTLTEGESIFIPFGVEHRAVNTDYSIMMSIGLERFLKEKL